MASSAFVISLDLEQHWGVYDLATVEAYRERLDGGRRAIIEILDRFETRHIHASWATVGLLLCDGRQDALARFPQHPHYDDLSVDIRQVIARSGDSEADDPYHYGHSLARRIADTPGQEIATHTFSHFYCLEKGPTVADFERDLAAAKDVARLRGHEVRAIVFPRNQYSPAHLAACARSGLAVFRGNPEAGPYRPRAEGATSRLTRVVRLLDAHLGIVPADALVCRPRREAGLVNVPASRFLRPVTRFNRHLVSLRLRRIRREMSHAARIGAGYHLWWHPHNFGTHTAENLAMLDAIIDHYEDLRDRHGMLSMTMSEAAARA